MSGRKSAEGAKSFSPNPIKGMKTSVGIGKTIKSNSESHHSSINKGYESSSFTADENLRNIAIPRKKQLSYSPSKSKVLENYLREVLTEQPKCKNQQQAIEFIRKHLWKEKNKKENLMDKNWEIVLEIILL